MNGIKKLKIIRMKVIVLAIILQLANLAYGVDLGITRVKLIDFERSGDIASAIHFPGGDDVGAKIDAVTSDRLVMEGRRSLSLFLPTALNNGPRWPHVIITKKAFSRNNDLRMFHRLTFDIHVLKAEHDILGMLWRGNGLSPTQYFRVHTGDRKQLKFEFNGWQKRQSHFDSITLMGCDLKTDNRYVIDNFQLELDYALLDKDILAFKRQVKNCSDQSILHDIKKLDGDNQLRRAELLCKLQDRYAAWKKKVRETERDHILKEFRTKNRSKVWGYGASTTLEPVFRNLPFSGTVGEELSLSLAQNETEGIQLVLNSSQPVEHVSVSVSPLVGPDGTVIDQVKTYLVGHVKTAPPCYEIRVPNQWRPDPLIDFQADFKLDSNVFQAIWIDVKTQARQKAGIYRGTVRVTGDDVMPLEIPFTVNVWNFSLPSVMTFDTFFNHFCDYLHFVYEKDKSAQQEFRRYYRGDMTYQQLSTKARRLADIDFKTRDLLLEHHLTPDRMYPGPNNSWKLPELKDIFAKHGKGFNLFYVASVPTAKPGESYPAWRRKMYLDALAKLLPTYKKAGLLEQARLYAFDEVRPNGYFMAQQILSEIKQLYPELPLITTLKDRTYGKKSGLRDLIDIWVPATLEYDESRKEVDAVRKEGKKVWYYTADAPYYPYANLNLEDPAAGQRLLVGFMARQQKSDGFLYWAVTSWKTTTSLIDKGPLTNHDGASLIKGFNGAGILVYPTLNGPIPSMRLKQLRDGLEDYEYTVILRKVEQGRLTPAQRREWKELLQVPADVCTSVKSYDMDGEHVLNYRKRLGDFLSSVK